MCVGCPAVDCQPKKSLCKHFMQRLYHVMNIVSVDSYFLIYAGSNCTSLLEARYESCFAHTHVISIVCITEYPLLFFRRICHSVPILMIDEPYGPTSVSLVSPNLTTYIHRF